MVSIGIVEITEERKPEPVAEDLRMALQELLRKAELDGDVDFLRDGVRVLAQELMEIEVAQHVGAERYERGAERTGERNGYRDRTWDTRVGSIELRVPRVRDGGYYPALLEPTRSRSSQALTVLWSRPTSAATAR